MLSLSAPGLAIVSSLSGAKDVARKTNEQAAEIRDAHPDRFGFFATLPLDSIADGLEELRYALDVLGADGVTLFTSYGGRYLGHEDFRPLWRELNTRAAVVFVHPTSPEEPGAPHDVAIPRPIIDFPHETTRAAVHLITSKTVREHPDCKIILSHGGGTLPYVATRIAHVATEVGLVSMTPEEFLADAKTFYYDLALTSYDDPIALLTRFAAGGHILWGSDYPFVRDKTLQTQLDTFSSVQMESEPRQLIKNGAAVKLFPRLVKLFSK